LSKSCQKVVKKLSKSCQKVSKNSETGRRRRTRRRRRFVVPRPGTTLSHLVKIPAYYIGDWVLVAAATASSGNRTTRVFGRGVPGGRGVPEGGHGGRDGRRGDVAPAGINLIVRTARQPLANSACSQTLACRRRMASLFPSSAIENYEIN
jgi:hypothetical protein